MSTEKREVRTKHAPLIDLNEINTIEAKPEKPVKTFMTDGMDALNEEQPEEEVVAIRKMHEDGKFKTIIPSALQGLSPMLLPPLTKNKVAIYEVLGADKIDPLTKERVDVPPLILPGQFTIYDRFERDPMKKFKLLKYITRSEAVTENGRQYMKEVMEDIVFVNGRIMVPVERNYLLYVLLELHPLNESNRNRDTTSPDVPQFRRQDMDRKNWSQSITAMDLSLDAENTVVKMRTQKEIVETATALHIPTANRNLEGNESIKHDLRVFARNHPIDFFRVVKNTEAAVKLQVMDAIQIGLVEWNLDRREWYFTTNGALIGTVPVTHDATDGLIKLFLQEEYLEHYKLLVDQLNYWD